MYNQLHRVDLNLLVALQVLLEERNVTRSAERLFITQPAMSKTLQRLRDLFEDPLFTRTSHGLLPTPKAEELERPLAEALERMAKIVSSGRFDPAEAVGVLHIASTETISSVSIPPILQRLYDLSPGVKLMTRNIRDDHLERLRLGVTDFSIYIRETHDPEFIHHPLAWVEPVCFMRRGHPLTKYDKLSMKALFSVPHVSLYMPHITAQTLAELDAQLAPRGIQRQSILITSQLMTALEIVGRSDVVVMATRAVADIDYVRMAFEFRPIPNLPMYTKVEPMVYMIQHQRTQYSQLHTWIREQFQTVFEENTYAAHADQAQA